MLNLEYAGVSLQAMRHSGGVVPALGQGWGVSALVLGTVILLTQYLVSVQSVHQPQRRSGKGET